MSSVAEKLARKQQKSASTKQVRLKLVYIDFWSALKLGFLVSVIGAVIFLVAVLLIWLVLNTTGVIGKINDLFVEVLNDDTFDLTGTLALGPVMGFAAVIGVLNVVVGTALSAIFALLYNLSVRITGGLLVGFTNN